MEKLKLAATGNISDETGPATSRKRAHSSTSDSSPFKSPSDPPKKAALDRTASTGEDGLSSKKQKELIETEERLKMQ